MRAVGGGGGARGEVKGEASATRYRSPQAVLEHEDGLQLGQLGRGEAHAVHGAALRLGVPCTCFHGSQ